jgi:hypothetical protein
VKIIYESPECNSQDESDTHGPSYAGEKRIVVEEKLSLGIHSNDLWEQVRIGDSGPKDENNGESKCEDNNFCVV